MRGVFKDRESDEIIGYVPVVIARLSCGYDEDEEEHNLRFTFQLSEKALNKLSRALERYKKQLNALKKAVPEHLVCFEDIEDNEDNGE